MSYHEIRVELKPADVKKVRVGMVKIAQVDLAFSKKEVQKMLSVESESAPNFTLPLTTRQLKELKFAGELEQPLKLTLSPAQIRHSKKLCAAALIGAGTTTEPAEPAAESPEESKKKDD